MPHEPGHVPAQLEGFPVPPPVIGQQAKAPNFIGMPSGFMPDLSHLPPVPGRTPFSPIQADRDAFMSRPRTPLYTEGMELDPAGLAGEDIAELQDKMLRAGLLKPKKFKRGVWFGQTVNAYAQVLAYANSRGLPASAALDELIEQGGVDLDGEEAPFTGSRKRTDKRIVLTDPKSAQAALRRTLREELGRGPRPEELREFIAALNAAEQQNPQVSQTTENFVDGIGTGSTTTTSGGLDAGAFLESHVETDPELATERNTFRVATDYYDAAMSVLGEGGR